MKKETLPDYRKKQQLLYAEKRSEGELVACGDAFLKAGRLSDAIEFYQRANHRAGLDVIKETARRTGDAMLLLQVCKAMNRTPSEEDWLLTGKQAVELKKYDFAIHAFEKSGNNALLQEIRDIVNAEGN